MGHGDLSVPKLGDMRQAQARYHKWPGRQDRSETGHEAKATEVMICIQSWALAYRLKS